MSEGADNDTTKQLESNEGSRSSSDAGKNENVEEKSDTDRSHQLHIEESDVSQVCTTRV